MLQCMAGRDPLDSTSADVPVPDYQSHVGQPVTGVKIGVPKEYFGEGLDAEVRAAVDAAIQELAKAGCEIVPISLPHTEYAIPTYYVVATAEASSNLARYDGVRYGARASDGKSLAEMYRRTRDAGLGTEVKRRIMLGTYALSAGYYDAYYRKAQQVRSLLARDFGNAFADGRCDCYAYDPDCGVQAGRENRRSARHVSGRHLHCDRKSGRRSRNLGALRKEPGRLADRRPDSWQVLRRADRVARRTRRRACDGRSGEPPRGLSDGQGLSKQRRLAYLF